MNRVFVSSASVSPDIEIDLARIWGRDEIFRAVRRGNLILATASVILSVVSAVFFFFGQYFFAGITVAVALVMIYLRVCRRAYNINYLKTVYLEGLLIPAVVRTVNPTTIMAVTRMAMSKEATELYACCEMRVDDLSGHNVTLGERVACVATFTRGSSSDYWRCYEFRPLCWATGDMDRIRFNETCLDGRDWRALDKLARSLPGGDLGVLHILDDNYCYIESRKYFD